MSLPLPPKEGTRIPQGSSRVRDLKWLLSRKRSQIEHYEADHLGRVYSCHEDGSVWPTGVTLPKLAGLNHISKELFRAERAEAGRV